MVSPWPFVVWGIDIIGALPVGKRNVKYAMVTIDYFTKWIEVEPLVALIQEGIELRLEIHNLQIWNPPKITLIMESRLIATSSKIFVTSSESSRASQPWSIHSRTARLKH